MCYIIVESASTFILVTLSLSNGGLNFIQIHSLSTYKIAQVNITKFTPAISLQESLTIMRIPQEKNEPNWTSGFWENGIVLFLRTDRYSVRGIRPQGFRFWLWFCRVFLNCLKSTRVLDQNQKYFNTLVRWPRWIRIMKKLEVENLVGLSL